MKRQREEIEVGPAYYLPREIKAKIIALMDCGRDYVSTCLAFNVIPNPRDVFLASLVAFNTGFCQMPRFLFRVASSRWRTKYYMWHLSFSRDNSIYDNNGMIWKLRKVFYYCAYGCIGDAHGINERKVCMWRKDGDYCVKYIHRGNDALGTPWRNRTSKRLETIEPPLPVPWNPQLSTQL